MDEFFRALGVAVDRPDEVGSIEGENEIRYLFASYTVCGKIPLEGKHKIALDDGGLSLEIVMGDGFVPNEQTAEYFVVTVYHIVLPWGLAEPFPAPGRPRERRLGKSKAFFRRK